VVRLAPTKLRPPLVDARIKRRDRIDTLLAGGQQITLVVGPAGYGKTTAVAQWSERVSAPLAWLTIDSHDGTAERFWRYTAAALRSADPMLGDETIRSLDEWGPEGYDIVSTLLAELGDEHETVVLVFDDVQLLVDHAILDQLAFFLERSPAWLRTILISRNDPNLPLARWPLPCGPP
jgi:ATP/maltotriose-dependent transcriptional regulator MalT